MDGIDLMRPQKNKQRHAGRKQAEQSFQIKIVCADQTFNPQFKKRYYFAFEQIRNSAVPVDDEHRIDDSRMSELANFGNGPSVSSQKASSIKG